MKNTMTKLNKLNTIALTLLITGAIDGIRNLPAIALFGSTLIFFLILSAITFLIPVALISAELAANIGEGGIYQWTRLAFGERIGFLAVWLQWISNIIWFPLSLTFIAGTAAYLMEPTLAQNKYYLVGVTLLIFWILTFINLKGVYLSSKLTSFSTISGWIIPLSLIIGLLIIWLLMNKPLQIHLTHFTIWPDWRHYDNWTALTATMMGFVGMELATVHIKEVNEPQKTFPKALGISTIIILSTRILGSLAIAFVIPYNQIHLVNGSIETFSYFLSAYHLSWITPILTILIVIGCLGGMMNWITSPIKGLSQSAQDGFLPPIFEKQNKYNAPQNLLITQAMIVSIICLTFLYLPSINESYWLLSALSMQLYMFMYALLFLCALRLRNKMYDGGKSYAILGKITGLWCISLLGLSGCAITLVVGFIPPIHMSVSSNFDYEILFCSGIMGMTLPVFLLYWYQLRSTRIILGSVKNTFY